MIKCHVLKEKKEKKSRFEKSLLLPVREKQQCVISDNTTHVGISNTVLASGGFFSSLFMLFLARYTNNLDSGCSRGERGSDPAAFRLFTKHLNIDADVWYFMMIRTYCFPNVQNIVLL